ncbi:hypothetical protein TNCV_4461571 [Trichonephila clavipes]|nr:hypothetical protein TNCV_4461571 [Trichonephila clavipes]
MTVRKLKGWTPVSRKLRVEFEVSERIRLHPKTMEWKRDSVENTEENVLKSSANDRRNRVPCYDEFRGNRSDTVDHVALKTTIVLQK